MATKLTPAIAQVIGESPSAADAYRRLKGCWYLSIRALFSRDAVEALIDETWRSYPRDPPPLDRDPHREVAYALRRAGYVGIWGMTWGGRFVPRRGSGPPPGDRVKA